MQRSARLLWLALLAADCAATDPTTPEPLCGAPSMACGGLCVDPSSDGANCGGCGLACAPGLVCGAALCQAHCPSGLTLCGQSCIDISSSPDHCGDCATSCAASETCQSKRCIGAVGTVGNPGLSCKDILTKRPTAPDGSYYILSSSGQPLAVNCDMTTDGGGWTLLKSEVILTLGAVDRSYLYKLGSAWYKSPVTQLVWSYTAPQEQRGSYSYYDPSAQRLSSFNCNGSAEQPQYGIGCSNGSASLKLIPSGAQSPAAGTCTICQDLPGIFPTKCAGAVGVWVR